MKKHAWNTWGVPAGKEDALWLRDELPNMVPKARILLYQYDASAAYSKSQSTFIDKASQLLEALRIERKLDPDRPLILMGHSMGGLLIEQALINAHNNEDYKKIKDATYASQASGSCSLLTLTPQGFSRILCYSSEWRSRDQSPVWRRRSEDRPIDRI